MRRNRRNNWRQVRRQNRRINRRHFGRTILVRRPGGSSFLISEFDDVRRIALNADTTRPASVRRCRSGRSAGCLRSTTSRIVGGRIAGVPSLELLSAPARSSLPVVGSRRNVTPWPGRSIIVGAQERALAFRVERRRASEAPGRTGLAGPIAGLLTKDWSGRER